jgi:hypothetical protein
MPLFLYGLAEHAQALVTRAAATLPSRPAALRNLSAASHAASFAFALGSNIR